MKFNTIKDFLTFFKICPFCKRQCFCTIDYNKYNINFKKENDVLFFKELRCKINLADNSFSLPEDKVPLNDIVIKINCCNSSCVSEFNVVAQKLNFEYDTNFIKDIYLDSCRFFLIHKNKTFITSNNYTKNKCTIVIPETHNYDYFEPDGKIINTPLLKLDFNNITSIIDKINTLLIFL